jgi:predicted glycoside hydrolase/deacetylase ChbG (UPF0249 family)
MVPCPWFPAVAARCRKRPELDVGVHLTLTSEWDGYRWGPLSSRNPASGLLDEEGYFYRNQDQWRSIDPQAVRGEVEAQLDRAVAAGLDLTHIDCHMFSLVRPCLVDQYVSAGLDRDRVADFETFRDGGDGALAHYLRRAGIQVIGWRPLRELMRARCNQR